jgi:hypothetical protein
MDTVFENKITLTKEVFYESIKALFGKPFRILAILWSIGLIIIALFELCLGNFIYFIINILLVIFILFYENILFKFYANKRLKQKTLLNNGDLMQETIGFSERIQVTSSNKSESFFNYAQITRIYETKHLLILRISRTLNVNLDKNNFTIGNIEEFEKFISFKCPSARFIHR